MRRRTTVGIIGAGPAGLVLANVLGESGIDCIVVEHRPRAYVEGRARAGFLEHRTVEYLRSHGLADRLDAEALRHVRCEFRADGRRFSVPYGELAGGRFHSVYPQQLLVRDLIRALLGRGGEILFSHSASGLTGVDSDRPVLTCTSEEAGGSEVELECDVIAGCDGFRGVARSALPTASTRSFARRYPYDWLTVLAEVPPPGDEVVYAMHSDGFAGQMPRTPQISRFYLQCPPDTTTHDWPDDRIWKELQHRLAVDGADQLAPGPVLEKGVLRMRSAVTEPMQHGNLFLAGDAAHILTPAGAKGMNLAIADAAALADALAARVHHRRHHLLRGYSASRLPEVWRAQEFSDWLLGVLHRPGGGDRDGEFHQRLWRARLDQLEGGGAAAAAFARSYVG